MGRPRAALPLGGEGLPTGMSRGRPAGVHASEVSRVCQALGEKQTRRARCSGVSSSCAKLTDFAVARRRSDGTRDDPECDAVRCSDHVRRDSSADEAQADDGVRPRLHSGSSERAPLRGRHARLGRPTEAPLGRTRCVRCIGTTSARASSDRRELEYRRCRNEAIGALSRGSELPTRDRHGRPAPLVGWTGPFRGGGLHERRYG
jgi:hypothetical protein